MTRDTYTKAASLAALNNMVPAGKLTVVGEQTATMARDIPHIFREEILADRFERAVVGFNKEATIGTIEARKSAYNERLNEYRQAYPSKSYWEALHTWTADNLTAAVRHARDGSIAPWPRPNFSSDAFARLGLHGPIQRANEIDKTVGFPILSPRYRAAFKRPGIDSSIDDPELLAAITRRVVMATLQPASTFMNAIRERLSIVQRAGGRSARKGSSYINGAAYSPRVLIAPMNIWRVHYDFFDWRTYTTPTEQEPVQEPAETRTRSLPVPGTEQSILVPVRRSVEVTRTTEAMRLGIHTSAEASRLKEDIARAENACAESDASCREKSKAKDRRRDDRPYLPNLARILYQPWLFHGTPM